MTDARRLQNFIGGGYVDAATGSFTDVIDPATAAVIARAPVSAASDVDAAYAAADAAFRTSWGRTHDARRAASRAAEARGRDRGKG